MAFTLSFSPPRRHKNAAPPKLTSSELISGSVTTGSSTGERRSDKEFVKPSHTTTCVESAQTGVQRELADSADGSICSEAAKTPVIFLPSSAGSGLEFCNEANLADCVEYINQSLISLELDFFIALVRPLTIPPKSLYDTIGLVNCLYGMLQHRKSQNILQNETFERIGKLESEKDMLSQRVKSLTSALEHSERENALAIERLKSYHREFQEARRQWDHEKGDMQREIANLQHRDNQFQHELRKRDRDIEKLQKRLQAAVGDRSKDTRGMEVTGPAAAKAAAAKAKTGEEIYRTMVRSIEEKNKALLAENEELRKSLKQLSDNVAALQEQITSADNPAESAPVPVGNPEEDEELATLFAMPMTMSPVRTQLEARIKQRIDVLRERVEKRQVAATAVSAPSSEVILLRKQIADLQRIVEEQDKLLQFSLSPVKPSSDELDASFDWEVDFAPRTPKERTTGADKTAQRSASEKEELFVRTVDKENIRKNNAIL